MFEEELTTLTVGKRASVLSARRVDQDAVISMGLDVLLQVLRSLECLATEVALVRLERDMDADMRCDVITLDGGRAACAPLASQVEVVGAFATDMSLANVVLRIATLVVLME